MPSTPFWMRRELSRSGKTRAFANDRQIKLSELQNLGEQLADLCGQHQQQQLLNANRHVESLDEFAGTKQLVESVRAAWTTNNDTRSQLIELRARCDRQREQAELRRFQIDEIRVAAVSADEDEKLSAERLVLRNAHRLIESVECGMAALSDGDENVDVVFARLLRDAAQLQEIDTHWSAIVERLTTARDAAQEAAAAFSDYRRLLDFDPARLDEIEARLAELHRLKLKYGPHCQAILDRLAVLESEDESADHLDRQLVQLEEASNGRHRELVALATDLSKQRHTAAQRLEKRVNSSLADLGMSGARIAIEIKSYNGLITEGAEGAESTDGIRENGSDQVRILFEGNPKEGFKPLDKIASGGELSRLLLAVKSAIISENKDTAQSRLSVFDEIDSGIGGETAHRVAASLAKLAGKSQVFLISHLQQMAAVADHHVLITKEIEQGRARVCVEVLSGKGRVRELARMVAGDQVTDRTIQYASELVHAPTSRR